MARVQIEPKMRVGEIVTLLMVAIALIGGWFTLQEQVKANTATIQQTTKILENMQNEVSKHHDWQLGTTPAGTIRTSRAVTETHGG